MKKFNLLLVSMLLGFKCLMANPVLMTPKVYINEIMFDAEKGWMLELKCFNGHDEFPYLSMTVSSSSGSAESNYLPVWGGYYVNYELVVLIRDSMKSDLDINPLGDRVEVCVKYLNYEGELESVNAVIIFGDYQGSRIKAPFKGQSIGLAGANLSDIFQYAKTNEPTMGKPNNVSKMYGTLTGKIYDKNNQLILSNDSMTFFYSSLDDPYQTQVYRNVPVENGTYSIKTLANNFTRDYVYMSNKKIKIKPIKVAVEPDAVIEQDIYLLEDYTGIGEVTTMDNAPIRIYPNPLSGGQELQYTVGVPVKSLDCRMEIITIDGRLLFERKITDNVGAISLPQSLPNGTYIVNFKLNNKTHYATRLIIGQ